MNFGYKHYRSEWVVVATEIRSIVTWVIRSMWKQVDAITTVTVTQATITTTYTNTTAAVTVKESNLEAQPPDLRILGTKARELPSFGYCFSHYKACHITSSNTQHSSVWQATDSLNYLVGESKTSCQTSAFSSEGRYSWLLTWSTSMLNPWATLASDYLAVFLPHEVCSRALAVYLWTSFPWSNIKALSYTSVSLSSHCYLSTNSPVLHCLLCSNIFCK